VFQTAVADAQGEFVLHVSQALGAMEPPEPHLAANSPTANGGLFVAAQSDASMPVAGDVADGQPAYSMTASTLPLAVVEQVLGNSEQSNKALGESAVIEPGAIFNWQPPEQMRTNMIRDLASWQALIGVNQTSQWTPDGVWTWLNQVSSSNSEALSSADVLGSLGTAADDDSNLAIEAVFARVSINTNRRT
jgi:hypothetical protein